MNNPQNPAGFPQHIPLQSSPSPSIQQQLAQLQQTIQAQTHKPLNPVNMPKLATNPLFFNPATNPASQNPSDYLNVNRNFTLPPPTAQGNANLLGSMPINVIPANPVTVGAIPTNQFSNAPQEFDLKSYFKDQAERVKKEVESDNERKKLEYQQKDPDQIRMENLSSSSTAKNRKRKRQQSLHDASSSLRAKKVYDSTEILENTWEQRRADEALERYLRNAKLMTEIFNFSNNLASPENDQDVNPDEKIGFENEEWAKGISSRIDAITGFLEPRIKTSKNSDSEAIPPTTQEENSS